ncbi:MAG TPA: bifunctional UDP-N-acetylglucosamine diphosphorylase/glucosamine-1-phosphate N-acetyltransferase GlmU [Terriglobales bacterium]|nr:bifunctional UDP-N-acetylglucosamine diphosphorylase/glucosamine-1-phosphate N-acetyltransferase GlmU [Terriglobales bacterium]
MAKSKKSSEKSLSASEENGKRSGPRGAAGHEGRLAIAIMAAGKGTRLKSKLPKVLHEVGGKPLLGHVVRAATQVVPAHDVYAIIGHEADRVRHSVAHCGIHFLLQKEQRGTGHALMVAREALETYHQVIVLSGDAPLITPETITRLSDFHGSQRSAMTILTAVLADPTGYGRVIRKPESGDEVQAVVEEKSATAKQKKINEINSGFYAFSVRALYHYIDRLTNHNPHGEFYLTDMAAILRQARERVLALRARDPDEVLGGNTRAELADIDQRMRLAKCQALMAEGVTIFHPGAAIIDPEVEVGPDTVVEPFVELLGTTRIGSDCRISSYCVVRDSIIGDGTVLRPGCILEQARVSARATLGPYSHLRPGSEIGEGAHLGNFVETKKVRLGKGSKANHLTYLGDAEIGEGVNIGAGTITCNYDGVHKHTTVIEDGVFVGSDATLVAPVHLGKGAYVGAASCITEDVPADALAIARGRQMVKEGWAKQRRESQRDRAKPGR